ncbi:MAG TPA: response regulator [Acidimicrobiales bacterium]|nr:response regulator [Acidimicrobiales bacterium]
MSTALPEEPTPTDTAERPDFRLASCSRLYPSGDIDRDEADLRRSLRISDAVIAFDDWLLVATAGDDEAAAGAHHRLEVLGWDVRPVAGPYRGEIALAAEVLGPQVRPRHSAPRSDRRLLLVEDDPELTYFLRDLLEQEGWRVTSVSGPQAAAQAWSDDPPDLMIIGFLGGPDAAELCLAPRREGYHFPVLVCSDTVSPEVRQAAAGAGAPVVSKLHRLYLTAALAALLPD